MSNKQSSIEWLAEQLRPAVALQGKIIDEYLKQAKAMHRKECFSFYEKGADDEFNGISNNAFEYYKEKFGIEDE